MRVLITLIVSYLLNDFRLALDRKVFLGKLFHDFVNTRFFIVESYGNFVSEWICIVLKNTRDFLQGITYPGRCDLSLTSGDHNSDYLFGC